MKLLEIIRNHYTNPGHKVTFLSKKFCFEVKESNGEMPQELAKFLEGCFICFVFIFNVRKTSHGCDQKEKIHWRREFGLLSLSSVIQMRMVVKLRERHFLIKNQSDGREKERMMLLISNSHSLSQVKDKDIVKSGLRNNFFTPKWRHFSGLDL